jgi:hypothetical protein
MSFSLTQPIKGLGPADSISISVATAIGVTAIYGSDVGPVADVHATAPGAGPVNAAIRKAGCKAWALVAVVTLFTRDLNVAIIGGAMVVAEHVMYLHAEMSSPANGQIEPKAGAYQPATPAAAANLSVVA